MYVSSSCRIFTLPPLTLDRYSTNSRDWYFQYEINAKDVDVISFEEVE